MRAIAATERGITATRLGEPTREAEQRCTAHVVKIYEIMLMRKAKSWFTGYNSNVAGHEEGTIRNDVAAKGYEGLALSAKDVPQPGAMPSRVRA